MNKIREYPESHYSGTIFLENIPEDTVIKNADIGIQIAKDGRIWVCINGLAFLRFSPHLNERMEK